MSQSKGEAKRCHVPGVSSGSRCASVRATSSSPKLQGNALKAPVNVGWGGGWMLCLALV